MEKILIFDNKNNDKIVFYFDNNYFYGYNFRNNYVNKIDNSIFKYFKFILPSNNIELLNEENDYIVILDNETNFKHYIKDDKFDFEMFFKNNGELNILFNNTPFNFDINDLKKKFVYKNKSYIMSLSSLLLLSSCLMNGCSVQNLNNEEVVSTYETVTESSFSVVSETEISIVEDKEISFDDILSIYEDSDIVSTHEEDEKIIEMFSNYEYSVDDICKIIDLSPNLSEHEKDFFKNKAVIENVLPYVNDSTYLKYSYLKKLNGLDVVDLTSAERRMKIGGYYASDNVLHVRDYDENVNQYPIVAHEYMHLFQAEDCEYTLLIESSAELMAHEFYYSEIGDCISEIPRLKNLMEIIGPDPIMFYCYTGDFSLIEEKVKPFLSSEQYRNFKLDLVKQPEGSEEQIKRLNDLDGILNDLYLNIYGSEMKDDFIIDAIYNPKIRLTRYYFNNRIIDLKSSYSGFVEDEEGNVIWNENVPLPSINDKFGKSRVR